MGVQRRRPAGGRSAPQPRRPPESLEPPQPNESTERAVSRPQFVPALLVAAFGESGAGGIGWGAFHRTLPSDVREVASMTMCARVSRTSPPPCSRPTHLRSPDCLHLRTVLVGGTSGRSGRTACSRTQHTHTSTEGGTPCTAPRRIGLRRSHRRGALRSRPKPQRQDSKVVFSEKGCRPNSWIGKEGPLRLQLLAVGLGVHSAPHSRRRKAAQSQGGRAKAGTGWRGRRPGSAGRSAAPQT